MEEKTQKPNKCSNCLADEWELLEPPPNEDGTQSNFTFMALQLENREKSDAVNVAIDLWLCQRCGFIMQMGRKHDIPEKSLIEIRLSDCAEQKDVTIPE